MKKKLYNVVSLGSRDYYQVAIALHEADMLGWLLTDIYTGRASRFFGGKRFSPLLSQARIFSFFPFYFISYFLLSHHRLNRFRRFVVDYMFGFICGFFTWVTTNRAVVYSYYIEGFVGFYDFIGKKPDDLICFQVHPTPWFINKIIENDRELFSHLSDTTFSNDLEESYSQQDIRVYQNAIQKSRLIICASSVTARSLFEGTSLNNEYVVIPYGSKLERILVNNSCSSSFYNSKNKIRIISICQLSQRKGMHWAFEAMRNCGYDFMYEWVVVSSKVDPSVSRLSTNNVTFLSGLSDSELAFILDSADLFVMPSMIEGFGLVYIEALSRGVPIVYTENTGPHDFCISGVHGFEVTTSSSHDLEKLFCDIASGSIDIKSMRKECFLLAERINWADFRTKIIDAIKWN